LTIANVNEKLDVLCSSKDWKNGTRWHSFSALAS
jgi:hypothetical protein